jgi:phenylpropionate dioxygenase-like ring-hydroxylating dioxygenase large terminal subunit
MYLIFTLLICLTLNTAGSFKINTNLFRLFNIKNLNNNKKMLLGNHENWYVIGEKNEFYSNKLYKKTIWNKDYVVWKNDKNYFALDNHCSHRGASLANGRLIGENILCPYHGYEFNSTGILCKVPGLNFTNSKCQNIKTYQIKEQNGWVYLNINATIEEPDIPIYEEPEAKNINCTANFLNLPFQAYARIISENSLDVMHIAYVHSFGNIQVPSPIKENPPKLQKNYPYHYKTEYVYKAGEDSIAKKIFNSSFLNVDNEFILPHTQIVRVKFNKYVSTIITSITPINITHSQIFMKTYRSYWYIPNSNNIFVEIHNKIFDRITQNMMIETIMQDKEIVENIKTEHMNGRFNMRFDKFANVYRKIYEKVIHDVSKK